MITKKIIMFVVMMAAAVIFAAPAVTDVTAKQRYPWNGLVDITCIVSGIDGATNGLEFAVAVVSQNSGDVCRCSNFWVMQSNAKTIDREVHTNGNYRLLWDAQADLGTAIYSNMVVRVGVVKAHGKVQLWENGPYWATTNIGADEPWESGYYFWWGDTIGYKRENDKWVASDGSSSNFSFGSWNTPTYGKDADTLRSEGWITGGYKLSPEHDAAHVQWGDGWRMPTAYELMVLIDNCIWTWTATNGVNGYVVRGMGDYASNSIFLPASNTTDIGWVVGSGYYWASEAVSTSASESRLLYFISGYHSAGKFETRDTGQPIRPVQSFSN